MDQQRQFVCARCLRQAPGYFAHQLGCSKCKEVFYCSEDCQRAAVHSKPECRLLRLLRKEGLDEVPQTQLALTALTALRLCTTGGDDSPEAALLPELTTRSSCIDQTNRSEHIRGESLNADKDPTVPERAMFRRLAQAVHKRLAKAVAETDAVPLSTEQCLELLLQLEANGYGWWGAGRQCLATAVFPVGSFFNHSCGANVGRLQRTVQACRPQFEYYALCDIAPGTPTTVFYTRPDQVTAHRQSMLLQSYNFKCDCWRCTMHGEPGEVEMENRFLARLICRDTECQGVLVPVLELGHVVCSSCGATEELRLGDDADPDISIESLDHSSNTNE